MANSNGAIDWDDEVSSADAGDNAQSDDIVVLPDGIYPCKVMKVERGSFKGSQKLPPCNKVKVGDGAEVISPHKVGVPFTVTELYDEAGAPIEAAPHPGQKFFCRVPFAVKPGDIMRGQ